MKKLNSLFVVVLAVFVVCCSISTDASTKLLFKMSMKDISNKVDGAKALKVSGCKMIKFNKFSGILMTEKSVLQYKLPVQKLLDSATVILNFIPGEKWSSIGTGVGPQILFQLGKYHYAPNNITVIREPNGSVVIWFRDGKKGRSYYILKTGTFNPEQAYSLALSWDKKAIDIYLNGKKITSMKSVLPAKLPNIMAIACPSILNKNWSFSGMIMGASVYEGKIDRSVIIKEAANMRKITEIKPLSDTKPYIKTTGKLVQIGTSKFEMQVSKDGIPLKLYDKIAGKYLISNWDRGRGAWWALRLKVAPQKLYSNVGLKAEFKVLESGLVRTAYWRYRLKNGTLIKIYITPDEDGALKFKYGVDNKFKTIISMVYFPCINGIEKSKDGWVVIPHWSGILRRFKDFKYIEKGGPGHLSMLFIGLKTGKSTLLLMPKDKTGHMKFAIAGDYRSGINGVVRILWQNRDWIRPGERYEANFDYYLYNLANSGLRGIAEKYREWASKQEWFVSWKEKLLTNPVNNKILDGVVKMVAYNAVRGKYATREYKEKHCKNLSYDYGKFLKVTDKIENDYGVKPAYRYDGWYGRFDSNYPEYFPVDPKLGDFKKFIAENNKKKRLVFLHVNPIQADSDMKSFDINKMSKLPNGKQCARVWSRNKLYFCSPLLVLKEEVAAEKKIVSYGVTGLFEDVIGCTTMGDFNPNAGCKYFWRDSGTQALLKLSKALRAAMPGVFRGTEGGTERMIPDYDAFMIGGRKNGVPIFQMVYGDCIANVEGIGGGRNGENDIRRAIKMLHGQVLGMDGRYGWTRKYLPISQMTFETQNIFKQIVGKRIIDYLEQGDIRFCQWGDSFVCANLGKTTCPSVSFKSTPLGKVTIENMAPNSVVFASRNGQFATWYCQKVTINDKVIFEIKTDKSFSAAFDGKKLAIANVNIKSRTVAGDKDKESILVAGITIPGFKFNGDAMVRPEKINKKLSLNKLILHPEKVFYFRVFDEIK